MGFAGSSTFSVCFDQDCSHDKVAVVVHAISSNFCIPGGGRGCFLLRSLKISEADQAEGVVADCGSNEVEEEDSFRVVSPPHQVSSSAVSRDGEDDEVDRNDSWKKEEKQLGDLAVNGNEEKDDMVNQTKGGVAKGAINAINGSHQKKKLEIEPIPARILDQTN
ncbi:hypothetical protein RHGRI_025862 [Rhododendron griersonianum]|uniref:Uncharacterized protein n=1 Tax=Rhododendron griersonianum TaxID=479676 RepID=A0AAV6IU50_9ERIC|nr:hypothetical protein RHGRI_025862 [Rhododendron griersonianum]